jgi:hypothetical protein
MNRMNAVEHSRKTGVPTAPAVAAATVPRRDARHLHFPNDSSEWPAIHGSPEKGREIPRPGPGPLRTGVSSKYSDQETDTSSKPKKDAAVPEAGRMSDTGGTE